MTHAFCTLNCTSSPLLSNPSSGINHRNNFSKETSSKFKGGADWYRGHKDFLTETMTKEDTEETPCGRRVPCPCCYSTRRSPLEVKMGTPGFRCLGALSWGLNWKFLLMMGTHSAIRSLQTIPPAPIPHSPSNLLVINCFPTEACLQGKNTPVLLKWTSGPHQWLCYVF